ncbi:MAG: hypothetical protein ACLQDF_00235 [Desulfomonilia bacterium]
MSRKEKRGNLLKAASDIFMELGVQGDPGLYCQTGGNGQELVNAVISNGRERFLEMIASMVDGQDTAEAKMNSLIDVYYHFISRKTRWVSKEIILEHAPLCSIFEQDLDHYIQPLKDIIENILREGIKKGELRHIKDIDLTSHIIITSMMCCNYLFLLHNRHERIREAIRQMVEIFFAGMKTHQYRGNLKERWFPG